MQRGFTAPQVAVVLDVVVDQKCGVKELDGRGRGQGVVHLPAEGLAGGQAQRWPEALASSLQIVGGRTGKVRRHPIRTDIGQGRASGQVVIALERLQKARRGAGHGRLSGASPTSSATAIGSPGATEISTSPW